MSANYQLVLQTFFLMKNILLDTGCDNKTCFLRNVKEQQEDKDLEASAA